MCVMYSSNNMYDNDISNCHAPLISIFLLVLYCMISDLELLNKLLTILTVVRDELIRHSFNVVR